MKNCYSRSLFRPAIRLERTKESIQIINKLWKKRYRSQALRTTDTERGDEKYLGGAGEMIEIAKLTTALNFDGKYFRLKNARLYTLPSTNLPLYMAASGPDAIQVATRYTDGLISTSKPDNAKDSNFILIDYLSCKLSRPKIVATVNLATEVKYS
jgi:alkanesulfonate monooxygenase SsuD/methylene tetrahydromethanopterin reductase-like flavin-dependent oxidoreductase (luciferase family)